MIQREISELRRHMTPERTNMTHIYGCYVNANKEIISYLDEPLGLLSQEETETYMSLLKKALGGTLGKNLLDISFATRQVMDSEEHRLLSAMRKSELQDEELRERFYRSVIDAVDMEDLNYLILLAFDSYDVPHFGKDGEQEERGDVYKYILCAVCPVKTGKAGLGYVAAEKRFHSAVASQMVGAPALGFLFPAFDDRSANIYNALLYSRNTAVSHEAFIDAVFRTEVPMPAARQKDAFGQVLTAALEKDCSFERVQSVHEQLSERIALHKESKDPEPLSLSVEEMGQILENSGVDARQVERFCRGCEETFGPEAQLRPGNISDGKSMRIETPEVKIQLDPQFGYLIESRVIGGRKYILIAADSGVEINGIPVTIPAPETVGQT